MRQERQIQLISLLLRTVLDRVLMLKRQEHHLNASEQNIIVRLIGFEPTTENLIISPH